MGDPPGLVAIRWTVGRLPSWQGMKQLRLAGGHDIGTLALQAKSTSDTVS